METSARKSNTSPVKIFLAGKATPTLTQSESTHQLFIRLAAKTSNRHVLPRAVLWICATRSFLPFQHDSSARSRVLSRTTVQLPSSLLLFQPQRTSVSRAHRSQHTGSQHTELIPAIQSAAKPCTKKTGSS